MDIRSNNSNYLSKVEIVEKELLEKLQENNQINFE